jgi:hypothetical protein
MAVVVDGGGGGGEGTEKLNSGPASVTEVKLALKRISLNEIY